MSTDLESARAEIDDLNRRLLDLFTKRMELSSRIADIKSREGLPVFQPDREQEIVEEMTAAAPADLAGYVNSFYNCLFQISRDRQRALRFPKNGCSPFEQTLARAVSPKKRPSILVQGVAGAYSEAAAKKMYPGCPVGFVPHWDDVLYGVEDGAADYGILPLENTSAGSIFEVYDLMLRHRIFIVRAAPLRVEHCLLGVRGAKLSDIRHVYSNPNAFPQCADFFMKHRHMSRQPYLNTAMAAQYVALQGDRSKAAIASRENAHLYGLDILAESIQQNKNTRTRFVAVAKQPEFPENANKISLVFTVPHVTGSLCRTLARFANAGLNLTKIESRPKDGRNFEYFFCLEFTGTIRNKGTKQLLCALSEELPDFYFFGNYFEAD